MVEEEFHFKTKPAPQQSGVDGALWENLPLSNWPPTFDISVQDGFANALSTTLSNLAGTFSGYSNTLNTLTQNLQNAACSVDGMIDSLRQAQQMAEEFAENNNKTKIYVRAIGVQPAGTITSLRSFLRETREAVLDTGDDVGQIPKIIPAEVPLDPNAIAAALTANDGGLIEQLLEGGSKTLGEANAASGGLGTLGGSVGAGLEALTNNERLSEGFPLDEFSSSIVSILKDGDEVQYKIRNSPPVNPNTIIGTRATITGTSSASNSGTFEITGYSDASAVTRPNDSTIGEGIDALLQDPVSNLQQAVNFFGIKVNNPNGQQQSTPRGTVQIPLGGETVDTKDKIRSVLEDRRLLEPNKQRTIDVVSLVNVLMDEEIIGVDNNGEPLSDDLRERDRSIAIERISRLTGPTNFRVGGMVLVGQAANLPTLAAKVSSLAETLEFLMPAAEQLATQAAEYARSQASPSGIGFEPTDISLEKLDSSKNVGVMDAKAAKDKAENSGIFDYELPTLESLILNEEQPQPNELNAWRHFHPSDLIPGLADVFGAGFDGSGLQAAQTFGQGGGIATGIFGETVGSLAQLIENGKASVSSGMNDLQGQSNAVDGIVNEMNQLNDKMVKGINFLKNQIQKNPFQVEGHLIGPELNLLSNSEYADQIEEALRDATDPNRPTFGPPPASSVFDTQAQLDAALQGTAPQARNTRMWFGVLIFIVGNGRKDLGEQMRSIAELLSMDTSPIDIEEKPTLSLKWKKTDFDL